MERRSKRTQRHPERSRCRTMQPFQSHPHSARGAPSVGMQSCVASSTRLRYALLLCTCATVRTPQFNPARTTSPLTHTHTNITPNTYARQSSQAMSRKPMKQPSAAPKTEGWCTWSPRGITKMRCAHEGTTSENPQKSEAHAHTHLAPWLDSGTAAFPQRPQTECSPDP